MVTKPLSFNGRIQKIVSLMAGYCSVRFSYHLSSQSFEADSHLAEKVSRAYFDARVFHVPSLEVCRESTVELICRTSSRTWTGELETWSEIARIIWATVISSRRRWRASTQSKLSPSWKRKVWAGMPCLVRNPPLLDLSSSRTLNLLITSFNSYLEPYKWGVFVKKAQADKEGYDPKIQQTVTVLRSKWVMASFDSFYFPDESEEAQSFLSCKYTNEVLKFHQKFVDVAW